MRLPPIILGFAAAMLAQSAWAAPVTLAQVSYSNQFQEVLHDEFGVREGDVLSQAMTHYLDYALARHGVTLDQNAPIVIEITIVDAQPNHPTMQQIIDRPGLDPILSISAGGAELRAVLRSRDGAVLGEVSHSRYNSGLIDVVGAQATWTEARRAMREFAEKIADACASRQQL